MRCSARRASGTGSACWPAALDQYVLARTATIPALLAVGRLVGDAVEAAAGGDQPTVDQPDRPDRTVLELCQQRVAQARAEFTAIQDAAPR